MNRAVNTVLREKPDDPLSAIAALLLNETTASMPVFEKFVARRVFLYENPTYQTIKVNVFLNY